MYRLVPDSATLDQVAALPHAALQAYAGVLDVLALTPWNGMPLHEDNPDGPVAGGRSDSDMRGMSST